MLLTSQGYGDYVLLGGFKSAGLADVAGASSPRKWEQRPGYGLSGASTVFLGVLLSEFSIKFRLYGDPAVPDPDWVAWNAFEAAVLMKPPPNRFPRALDIWHPVLERLKIKAVGVTDVGQPVQTDDGEWTIEVKFIQYKRPRLTMAKPDGSQANKPDPFQQTEAALDQVIKNGGSGDVAAALAPVVQELSK